jgi:hypothetical protein
MNESPKSFTRFMDMHSGGGTKVKPYEYIYIEAPEAEARVIFYNRFGRNPDRVTCTCCGNDYSVDEHPSLEVASAYNRQCDYLKGASGWDLSSAKVTLEDYLKRPDVLLIRAEEIKPEERIGEVPTEGYVWA